MGVHVISQIVAYPGESISRGVLRCSSTSMDSQSIAASTETIVVLSRYVTYCNVTWPLHKDQLDFKTDSGR